MFLSNTDRCKVGIRKCSAQRCLSQLHRNREAEGCVRKQWILANWLFALSCCKFSTFRGEHDATSLQVRK